MNLFQNTDCEEVNQIVINTLETYKKFLVCEMDLQNKLSYATIEQLMHSLMIIFSYKKDYGHLHSLVSLTTAIVFKHIHLVNNLTFLQDLNVT